MTDTFNTLKRNKHENNYSFHIIKLVDADLTRLQNDINNETMKQRHFSGDHRK